MKDWKVVGNWLHGPDGERIRSLSGAQGGGGGGMGGGMGGGGGSSVDLTFGQGGVWADKTMRQMELLKALIGANKGSPVNSGSNPGPVQYKAWDPNSIRSLLTFVSGARG